MRIEDQVSPVWASEKLKQLGIAQVGQYSWIADPNRDDYGLSNRCVEELALLHKANSIKHDDFLSAFTLSELGLMMPRNSGTYYTGSTWKVFYCGTNEKASYLFKKSEGFPSEMEARCQIIIRGLTTGVLQAEYINEKKLKE